MIPNNSLTITETRKEYAQLDKVLPNPLSCWRRGGYKIGDPSLGLDDQTWVLDYIEGEFILSSESGQVLTLKKMTEEEMLKKRVVKLSFSFDQNMKYVWAYTYKNLDSELLHTELFWFDVAKNDYSVLELPNSTEVTLDLDDKRPKSNDINDIIVAYISSSNFLCLRYQRDRYSKEYSMMRVPPNSTINSLGFTKDFRFQIELKVPEAYKHNGSEFLVGSL